MTHTHRLSWMHYHRDLSHWVNCFIDTTERAAHETAARIDSTDVKDILITNLEGICREEKPDRLRANDILMSEDELI